MAHTKKTLIAVALRAEAKPVIEHFGLKQLDQSGGFRIYTNETVVLVISGVGRQRMAGALGMCFGSYGTEIGLAINIGVAGSVTGRLPIGSPALVNKLIEKASAHEYYPDLLALSFLREGSLTTVDQIVRQIDEDGPNTDLVDMEGTAFFSTAAMWLPPHQIQCFKVVSDLVNDTKPNASAVSRLIESALPDIIQTLTLLQDLPEVEKDPLDGEALATCDTLANHLRLTATQQVQLRDSFKRYLLLQRMPLPDFTDLFNEPVQTKHDGKRLLATIQKDLLTIGEKPSP